MVLHLRVNFNSIKVQLEQIAKVTPLNLCGFQFHKGTIRTRGCDISAERVEAISIP